MGGNVTATNKKTGSSVRADKIPLKTIGRKNFTNKFVEIFKFINKEFEKKNSVKLWVNEKNIENGVQFNGSTSYIFDRAIPDEEIETYKPSAGDLDIIVPASLKDELWDYLDSIEGQEILSGVWYMGSNRPTKQSITDQINCVFQVDFDGNLINAQVDFEFLEVDEKGSPSEWAKFSHSSSFKDAKKGIKAVHHKYLIQSLIGGASIRDDVVIVTPTSRPDKYKLKSMKGELPRFLKFSVGRGVRKAYELQHLENGEVWKIDGRDVYKELKTTDSTYFTVISDIYKLAFGRLEDNPQDIKDFDSFVGVIRLMKKYLTKKQIDATHDRYVEKLWHTYSKTDGSVAGVQVLERDNAEEDYNVKISGYNYFVKAFGLKPKTKVIDNYYKHFDSFGRNESFILNAYNKVKIY